MIFVITLKRLYDEMLSGFADVRLEIDAFKRRIEKLIYYIEHKDTLDMLERNERYILQLNSAEDYMTNHPKKLSDNTLFSICDHINEISTFITFYPKECDPELITLFRNAVSDYTKIFSNRYDGRLPANLDTWTCVMTKVEGE